MGIDAEIAQAIADKLGLQLKIEDMEFDSIITAVQTGKADLGLAGMTVTDERMEAVDFTDSYSTGVQVIIVPKDSAITSVDDLFAEGATILSSYSATPPATSIQPGILKITGLRQLTVTAAAQMPYGT